KSYWMDWQGHAHIGMHNMGSFISYFYNNGSQAKFTWIDTNGKSYWFDAVGHAYIGLHSMGMGTYTS
ncbi:hypothetical protein, partial [Weissella confusa]